MGIEARGAKSPYVYHCSAVKSVGNRVSINHATTFDVANSEDEAYGRAIKFAHLAYPQGNGWSTHFATVHSLAGIDWIGPANFDKVKPEP